MDLMGLCAQCGRPGIQQTCMLCGCIVCDQCYNQSQMICKKCSLGKIH